MSATATPTKRRVLGSLDVNVQMSPKSPGLAGSPLKRGSREASLSLSHCASPSPRKPASKDVSPKKRPLDEATATQPAVKKLCSDDAAGAVPAPDATDAAAAGKQQTVQNSDEDEPSASQPTTGDRRSVSPDASSLFDASGMNTSQDTTITEPDLDAPITVTAPTVPAAPIAPVTAPTSSISNAFVSPLPPPPPQTRRITTREELKQKTEILKLRLSLANYKVKTGQVDVPLERLQVRPVPGMTRRRTPLPSMSAHTVERSTPAQQWYRLGNDRRIAASLPAQAGRDMARDGVDMSPATEKHILPRLSSASLSIVSTPHKHRDAEEEDMLTSSALRGGAAKGLLSLSQGSVGR
ncbi:hypothetical protein J7T55_007504 [Diaporthe amygdali]|uniref:uncharacterized protein n=1 Tax=Phomopsis amygdali TaxID=1214568 RepID=UPI0022FEC752|nr:uncharacterized protein J7T55_007504 [Diaporthe amygdali]KAJ0116524.1 hypothetical protein J7T55_007504 [Diaporthe amygdali]